jgi:Ion transport protein
MLFRFDSSFRKALVNMLNHEYFERVMLFIIVVSTVQLAIDNPLSDPGSDLQIILMRIDYVLTSVFTFEAVVKIIAFGFVFCGSTSYLRSAWNTLDFFVVIVTVSI